MPDTQQNRLSVCHFPDVAELLENILLKLDTQGIATATGVCSFWKACIGGSRPLMRKLFKIATQVKDGDNPHFSALTEASRNAIIPRYNYQGQNLWNLVRSFEDTQLTNLHEVTGEYLKKDKYRKELRIISEPYWEAMYEIRAGFRGVRIPNGWPVGLRELHCDFCDCWHTSFQFENLHPLFEFLENMTMCFRGHGSQLMVGLSTVSDSTAPKECWLHSCEEARVFAKHLIRAWKAVKAGGVAKDYFAQPVVTKLASSGGWVIESEAGLTLDKVVPFLFKMFCGELSEWRERCHSFEAAEVTRGFETRRDTVSTYLTSEDWEEHMAKFSDITKLWEGMIAEVDELMADVSIWSPVLADVLEAPVVRHITL